MNESILELTNMARDFEVYELCKGLLEDHRFSEWPASAISGKHHYFAGGLAKHTLEVAELCLSVCEFSSKVGKAVNRRMAFLAALFHDSGKMWDYEGEMNWDGGNWNMAFYGAKHKRRIHHIS